uniref:MARVEL domain-containing protein n=1 Tax=Caenorhabditis tropicalis TaxID=1561998 RepID=A0A1I7SZU5_9PELO
MLLLNNPDNETTKFGATQNESDNTPHKSQNFLTLSTNTNSIQNVFNDALSIKYSGSRNSSVSINYPESKEEEANDLLLPSHVFFLKPCSKHKCCLGCISLRDAIPLICTIEIFSLVFCTVIAIDFWINNGKTFYTVNFEGYGTEIAMCYFIFLLISIAVICELKQVTLK